MGQVDLVIWFQMVAVSSPCLVSTDNTMCGRIDMGTLGDCQTGGVYIYIYIFFFFYMTSQR